MSDEIFTVPGLLYSHFFVLFRVILGSILVLDLKGPPEKHDTHSCENLAPHLGQLSQPSNGI
jgi:hypothetical protein